MAARGYWQAYQAVQKSIHTILKGKNLCKVAGRNHSTWYREMFGASVTAGILKAADLAGYRNSPVFIRSSMHMPLNVFEVIRKKVNKIIIFSTLNPPIQNWAQCE